MNAPFLRPHGCPIGIDPVRWRQAVADRIEAHHAAMQALIDALDGADADPDLEPAGDEQDTSWPERGPRAFGDHGQFEDAEIDDPDEDDGTCEPSLGAPDQGEHGTQELWAAGARGDHEREVDDDS